MNENVPDCYRVIVDTLPLLLTDVERIRVVSGGLQRTWTLPWEDSRQSKRRRREKGEGRAEEEKGREGRERGKIGVQSKISARKF